MSRNKSPVLAVDLGGTKIVAALVSAQGDIIQREYRLSLAKEGPEPVINRLLAMIGCILDKAKIKISQLMGVGIATAGILDARRGLVTASPNLPGWHDIPLRDIVKSKLGVSVYLINDASAAALGEHRYGAGRDVDNLIYLTVSTGIGGGIIIGGELYSGVDGCAGEIGHMTIETDGPQCSCSNFGCLEALASGTAVANEAISRVSRGEKSSLTEISGGRFENITAEIVGVAAWDGDPMACEIVAKAANYLGIGMANLVNIFNPEKIVIGGGMAHMGDMLLEPARRVVRERAFQLPAGRVNIVPAQLGDDAGVIGAAAFVFEKQSC